MVQANPSQKPAAEQRSHDKIVQQFANSDDMAADQNMLSTLSRTVSKMPGRNNRDTIERTIDQLFEIASNKMSGDADKAILANLR